MQDVAQTVLPRWRGFNLPRRSSEGQAVADDLRWIADWGFDWVRLPMSYRVWTEEGDVYKVLEEQLDKIDDVVRLAHECGLHVCLNFHRAPGYCVSDTRTTLEPYNLWKDAAALEAFVFHWQLFARRYRDISSDQLSFNLVNEPGALPDKMSREDHERVIRATVEAIRHVDPDRMIIVDGIDVGTEPCPELIDLGVAQSCRAYIPMGLTHYKGPWVWGENWPMPTWPGALHYPGTHPWDRTTVVGGEPWDRGRLEAHYGEWAALARQGVGVHCGEGGVLNHTPHDVTLRFLRDVLDVLTGYGIGYALWNLRGAFGFLDSERDDVAYEDWHGHQLDRKMLDLLREF